MSNIHAKGMSSSSEGDSRIEQAEPIATIRLLTNKYGLKKGSEHVVVGETQSGLHYLLKGGQHCVHKDHEDHFWDWAIRGPIPTSFQGSRSGRSASSCSSSSTSGGKRKHEETDPLKSEALSLGRYSTSWHCRNTSDGIPRHSGIADKAGKQESNEDRGPPRQVRLSAAHIDRQA